MKLPERDRLVVPPEKVHGYLLMVTHPEGGPKAVFFERHGFDAERWEELAEALRRHGSEHEVSRSSATEHGVKYVVSGRLQTPDGRNPMVVSVWIVDHGETVPRLVTAHPGPERRR